MITGPSGVGKSTITREVLRRTGAAFSISATTRRPRPGEAHGREYFFVDRPAFQQMIDRGELLEWAEVFGEWYGTPAAPIRQAEADGRCVLLEIDVQGGLAVHDKRPDATFVFVLPPSDEELARRLLQRRSEDEPAARRRLEKARQEIQAARESGVYNHYVVNDDLETAVAQVVATVSRECAET